MSKLPLLPLLLLSLSSPVSAGPGPGNGGDLTWLGKVPVAWKRGPVLDESAATVSHVYWRNGALVSTGAWTWSQVGTVPQVAAIGKTPPGAGAFSDANYDTTPNSVAAATDKLICAVVYWPSASTPNYQGIITGTVKVNIAPSGGLYFAHGGNFTTPGLFVGNALNILCVGTSGNGTTRYARLNAGAVLMASCTIQALGSPILMGRDSGVGFAWPGYVYEVQVRSGEAWSDATVDAIITTAKARLAITAW